MLSESESERRAHSPAAMRRALKIILGIAIFGLCFSGFLSYREVFATEAAQSCGPVGEPGTVLGYPACVYGFFMYLAVVTVAGWGLWRKAPTGPGTPSR